MAHSPTTHAGAASAALSAKLQSARKEEAVFAERLAVLETELALNVARLNAVNAPLRADARAAHQFGLLNQRIADLLELRGSLVAERARRRRLIDEMAQRKEAIDAALAVLREKAAPQLVAVR